VAAAAAVDAVGAGATVGAAAAVAAGTAAAVAAAVLAAVAPGRGTSCNGGIDASRSAAGSTFAGVSI